MSKRWTLEEIEYLTDNFGEMSFVAIGRVLKRRPQEVWDKAARLNLGSSLEAAGLFTRTDIARMLGIERSVIDKQWIPNGFRLQERKIRNTKYLVCDPDTLLDWLSKHQTMWNAAKVEEYALGIEPEWLRIKRKNDMLTFNRKDHKRYTKQEDHLISMLHRSGRNETQIANSVGRTVDSVHARLRRLNRMQGNEMVAI